MRNGNIPRANVWIMQIELNRMGTETDIEDLHEAVRQREAREPLFGFIWRQRGLILTVQSEGNPDLLTEIFTWATDNLTSPGPVGMNISRMLADRLTLKEGWSGHERS